MTVNTPAYGNPFYHCTFADIGTLITATASTTLNITNSILASVTNQISGTSAGVSAGYNGFYSATAFGSSQFSDSQWPFAPTGFTDQNGNQEVYFANGQGAYYLRDQSPFYDIGATAIPANFLADIQARSVLIPDVIMDDVIESETLGQNLVRDTDPAPALGYHYPAVDHVIDGLTVNSATLNIDQGTVLGFIGPDYEWAIRVNPGGRLNVNGSPTNPVVITYLNAVQESPLDVLAPWGATITFHGTVLDDNSGPVTPLASANFHYTQFPTMAGGFNTHFGNINALNDTTYDLVSNLGLYNCLLQGGILYYASGSVPGRTLTFQNTVFERTDVDVQEQDYGHGNNEEQFTASNNLFYHSTVWLTPVLGINWIFIDNLFDTVTFGSGENGPVPVNNHNAYAAMGSNRLSPAAPTTTDPSLPSQSYSAGPLGRFYLPSSATALIDTGSRSASAAGLYQFTSFTSNAKEAGTQVNIGPHYVALVNGAPSDYDADGIPDVIEDANGNGLADANESDWLVANTGNPVILTPLNNASVAGVISMPVSLGANAVNVTYAQVSADGHLIPNATIVVNPASSTAQLEVDTSYLANGTHQLAVQTVYNSGGGSSDANVVLSTGPVTVTVSNPQSFAQWNTFAQGQINIDLQTTESYPEYTIWYLPSTYAKDYEEGGVPYSSLTASSGTVSGAADPSQLGYTSADQIIFTVTEAGSPSSQNPGGSTANPSTKYDPESDYPSIGNWVETYGDDPVDYTRMDPDTLDRGNVEYPILDPLDPSKARWTHDNKLDYGWRVCGAYANGDNLYVLPNPGAPGAAQTWPVRTAISVPNNTRAKWLADIHKLSEFLWDTNTRNFYGHFHGSSSAFMGLDQDIWMNNLFQRYRFAFLDGCDTAEPPEITLRSFGASFEEIQNGMTVAQLALPDASPLPLSYYENLKLRPGAFLGWNVQLPNSYLLNAPQTDPTTGLS